jgi:hypothetical protein
MSALGREVQTILAGLKKCRTREGAASQPPAARDSPMFIERPGAWLRPWRFFLNPSTGAVELEGRSSAAITEYDIFST